MYESLIAFLLGKKEELTEEELNEFMDLLVKAMDVYEEYETVEKQSFVEKIVDSVSINDQKERKVISNAIESILEFDEESEKSQTSDKNLFKDESEDKKISLKNRKIKRGGFSNVKRESNQSNNNINNNNINDDSNNNVNNNVSDDIIKVNKNIVKINNIDNNKNIDINNNIDNKVDIKDQNIIKINQIESLIENKNIKPSQIFQKEDNSIKFDFEIGELEENHQKGPDFLFKLDE